MLVMPGRLCGEMVKPFKYLFLHSVWPIPTWAEIDFDEFLSAVHHPDQFYVFVFDGTAARITVITEDNQITRQEALKCASTFVSGAYKTITVNLATLTWIEELGLPLGHPPH